MTDFYTRDNCRLCESKDLREVFCLTPTPPANAFVGKSELAKKQDCFPLNVFQCNSCFHLQLLTVVSPQVLFKNYVYVSGTSPVFLKHFGDYASKVINRFGLAERDLVVDIGSNDGSLLSYFKQSGIGVLGVDPAVNIARKASEAGIETWAEFFNQETVDRIISKKQKKPKVICANNMFAHADDLIGITKNIKALLANDGVFIFEVSYLVDVYEKVLFDMTYHEHLAYHSVTPLISFFEKFGLELFQVERVNTHGGSIRCHVQHKDGPYSLDDSVAINVSLEKRLAFDKAQTFVAFGNRINEVGRDLTAILSDYRKENKKIIGYGAPAKATTLMYHFNLDSSSIDAIIDDNPLKQNLYSPGLHIPVLPSSHLEELNPDVILIFAWNFSDVIIENIKSQYEKDCNFIIPLPNVKVI